MAIQFMVLSIPRKYEDKEEDIWIKMMAFFPKASEEGRLEVELRACGCAVILTIR